MDIATPTSESISLTADSLPAAIHQNAATFPASQSLH